MTADQLRRDDGMALISVVMVSLVITALLALMLTNREHADSSSTRDRNSDLALSVAEAGVQEGIARVEASDGTYTGSFSGSTPQGPYAVTVSRSSGEFVVESRGTVGPERLRRHRVVRVVLSAPTSFRDAIFSNTSVELKNLSDVTGDIWANDSVLVEANTVISGSVTAARSWVRMDANSLVTDAVTSGGYNSSELWAVRMANGAAVEGPIRAAVSNAHDGNCSDESQTGYNVQMGSQATARGDLTTWGSATGTVEGSYAPHTCSQAPLPRQLPPFSYNANNYGAGAAEFSSVDMFQAWLSGNLHALQGTFYVHDPSPSQANPINLTGAVVTGDTTIITNAPIFTNGVSDAGTGEAVFVLTSSYLPPAGSACDVNHDSSECAIHVKNNFDPSCKVAVLVYANRGPVAMKNNASMCGAIYAEAVLVKNNQELTFDDRIARIVGFGATTYSVSRWEERTP